MVTAEVRRSLDRLLSSETFARSDRMKRFLDFTVSMAIEGRGDELKEYSIGLAAFDKPEDFDPRLDPIVRVEAGRLRSKLNEYYASEGREDDVLIRFPKRSYVPVFESRVPGLAPADDTTLVTTPAPLLVEGREAFREKKLDSIAVLPFADLSAKQDQDYFCIGITEELINVLGRVDGLSVAARTTVMQFRDGIADVRAIGQQLNVQAVLEGSVRTDGKRIRISTQLISVADGYNLWSDVYDQEMSGIFEVQEHIAQSIAQALKFRLTEEATRGGGTQDLEAYKLYLQGRHHWEKQDPESLRRAIRYFERAIERDSKYAMACAGMADAYTSLAWTGILAPEIAWERTRQFSERALMLDPASAHALSSRGAKRALFRWNWKSSEEKFRRAIELNPGYAPAHHWYGAFCLAPQGRFEAAERELQWARNLDPLAPAMAAHMGWVHYCRSQWDAALQSFETCLELDRSYHGAYSLVGYLYLVQGDVEKALESFLAALELQPRDTMALGGAGRCHAALGSSKKARSILQRLKRRNTYVPETDIAQIHIGAGETDAAFEWLESAAERRCARLVHLKVDPAYDTLRDDPRFARLLTQMSLDAG